MCDPHDLTSRQLMAVSCASIRPADAVEDSIVAWEKDRWLRGLVKKAKHPKVRSGCFTCKQRRLKCDETKPSCLRCGKSGRECAGYTSPVSCPPRRDLPTDLDHSSIAPRDSELLGHFLGEAADQLAGFSFSLKAFCQSLAPQLGHHYPAVRYALLSVAARTRAAAFRWDQCQPREVALCYKSRSLVYCNNAIQHLTTNIASDVPPEVYLVCGLLFGATEYWPHRNMCPTVHVLTAFRLVLRGTSMLPEAVKEGMFPFLVHMGRKTLAMADDVPPDLAAQISTFVWLSIRPPLVPSIFSSLNEAWSFMDTLVNYVGAFSHDDSDFILEARPDALGYATQLHGALLQTVSLLHPDDRHRRAQYRSLLMHHRALQIMLDAALAGSGEAIYDLFTADFEHIVYECELLLKEERQSRPEHLSPELSATQSRSHANSKLPRPDKPWHTTLGLLAPLFLTATHCRIPSLRHRAIAALHTTSRREREWNSCIATMLARFVVQVEQRHQLSSQSAQHENAGVISNIGVVIQAEHRVRLESVQFDRDREFIRVEYVYPMTGETGSGTLQWRVGVAGGIDDDFECVMVSRRRLMLSGYSGIMLITPRIACQCGADQNGDGM